MSHDGFSSRVYDLLGSLIGLLPVSTANMLRDSQTNVIDILGVLGLNYLLPLAASPPLPNEWTDVKYGDANELQVVDIFGPRSTQLRSCPCIVFFHGGAWGTGNKEMYRLFGRRLRDEGFVAVVAGYATYPAADADAQIQSVGTLVQWVRHESKPWHE